MSHAFFASLARRFVELEEDLNALDAATGDGDHGTTIRRGLEAAAKAEDGEAARMFSATAGGASGSLFRVLLGNLDDVLADRIDLKTALEKSADHISRLGMAKIGDKTMLDALVPAAEAASRSAEDAARAAAEGASRTTDMEAKSGRARYVENKGAGHVDPGARSVAEILNEFIRFAGDTR